MSEVNLFDVSPERLKALPQRPGVYLMRDKHQEVIYVGKAKDLRNRVRQYFAGHDERYSVQFLLERVRSVETIVTEDERQAIVLEADLIRQYKPRYNIRLKDDRAYLLVRIDQDADWPRIELVRAEADDGALYLGPYAFGFELRALLETIKRVLPLRTCSDNVLHNRARPCIEHQIKRCAAPCCLPVDRQLYKEWLTQAVRILNGKDGEVVKFLEAEMERASEELRFEDAAAYRDRMNVLRRIADDRLQVRFGDQSQHAFGLYREGSRVEFTVLMVRRGRLYESKSYGFSEVVASDAELLESIINQFYDGSAEIPENILVPVPLDDSAALEQLFSDRVRSAIRISVPKAGVKARLLELACANAQENFRTRFRDDEGLADAASFALVQALGLEEIPRTIECVDISHLQGTSTVASVVCFKDGKPDKSRYRHFVLSVEQNDDFASMNEVIKRHLSRCAEENTLCDLLVVDGGPPQLRQAEKVMKELGLKTPRLISLAKKRSFSKSPKTGNPKSVFKVVEKFLPQIQSKKPERVYLSATGNPKILDAHSEALHLLERLRDEAHRFAISFHRSRRAKRMLRSPLDAVPGIGPKRRQSLLKTFGSLRSLKAATAAEIAERCALPIALAERILRAISEKKDGVSTTELAEISEQTEEESSSAIRAWPEFSEDE